MPKYKKMGDKKRRFEDHELPDYHLHCRYCILHGLSMSQAAALWNERFKGKYSDRNEQINLLLSYFRQKGNQYVPEKEPPLMQVYFKEGEEYLSEVSGRKRDRALVKYRLEADNYKCRNCGFPSSAITDIADNSVLVEVHHINPIQDGERETKIEDLVTLCPNCHRLIHAIGRKIGADMLSMDLLKAHLP